MKAEAPPEELERRALVALGRLVLSLQEDDEDGSRRPTEAV